MGSVSSSSSADSSLSSNMAHLAFLNIKTFLSSIRLKVHEERSYVFDRLFWVSTVVMFKVFAHCVSSWTTGESSERDDGFMCEHIVHVIDRFLQIHTFACTSSLIACLEMSSQIINSAFSRFG